MKKKYLKVQGWEIENYKNKLISFEMIVADLKGKYFINFVIVADIPYQIYHTRYAIPDIPYGIHLSWELQNGILLIPTALSEYPMWPLLISCLIHSFFGKSTEKSKTVFLKLEVLPVSVY